jgi:hypothetical protein
VVKRRWQLSALIAFVAVVLGAMLLAQACGGGSASEDVTPTATPPPTSTADGGAPDSGDIPA